MHCDIYIYIYINNTDCSQCKHRHRVLYTKDMRGSPPPPARDKVKEGATRQGALSLTERRVPALQRLSRIGNYLPCQTGGGGGGALAGKGYVFDSSVAPDDYDDSTRLSKTSSGLCLPSPTAAQLTHSLSPLLFSPFLSIRPHCGESCRSWSGVCPSHYAAGRPLTTTGTLLLFRQDRPDVACFSYLPLPFFFGGGKVRARSAAASMLGGRASAWPVCRDTGRVSEPARDREREGERERE